jgi:hypothetical protein
VTRDELLTKLWKHRPAVRKLVRYVLGPNRKHHQEDLEMHCYAELTARIGQFTGKGTVLTWAMFVLKGVTADWLDDLIAAEELVTESTGTNPDILPHYDSPFVVDKAKRPSGAGPDADEELAEWSEGYVSFIAKVADDEAPVTGPVDAGLDAEVPPTCNAMTCLECAEVQKVLRQMDREEVSRSGNFELENKVSTFTLACGHARELTKTLNRKWKRPSRATGRPRGRPQKINAAVTL